MYLLKEEKDLLIIFVVEFKPRTWNPTFELDLLSSLCSIPTAMQGDKEKKHGQIKRE